MQAYGTRLKDHFRRELVALREDAAVFAESYPAEAEALRLGRAGSSDPHVDMLMQSFAFLTGRVRHEMEVAKALLPNAMLQQLQPHLAVPVPCMAVAQIKYKADGAPAPRLARGRQVLATVSDERGQRLECRFRTTCDTPLLPLRVAELQLMGADDLPKDVHDAACTAKTQSVLRVQFRRTAPGPVKALKIERLRLFIDTTQKHAYHLVDMLSLHLCAVSLRQWVATTAVSAADGIGSLQTGCAIQWLGFADDQAALPTRPHLHPGHRLLQEYFAFPEKFMFFEIGPLNLSATEGDFELLLHLDMPADVQRLLSHDLLKLNCVPLVNLYTQRIDPLAVNHASHEYWLRADVVGHRHCEIHSLEELVAIQADGSLKPLRPYFEMQSLFALAPADLAESSHFYVLRHEHSQLGQVAGTEAHVSFLDIEQRSIPLHAEVIAGRALCTNRRLPERLRVGQDMQLEGPGPVSGLMLVSRPTAHTTPALTGERPWALASQLSLNHLSLAGGDETLAALKRVLQSHLGPAGAQGVRHIDGLHTVDCRPVVRHLFHQGQRSFVHGLAVALRLDPAGFEHGSAVLFASVLRYFLALYASVNSVVEVSYASTDNKAARLQWPALAGAQVVL